MGCWVYPRFLYSIVSFFLGTYDSYELDIAFGLPFGWFFFFCGVQTCGQVTALKIQSGMVFG